MIRPARLTEPDRIVAVPSLQADAAGAIVWWRLEGTVDGFRLRAAWQAAGLDEEDLPALPSEEKAMRRAAKEQQEKHRLVRAIDGVVKAWAIVEERTDGSTLDYDVACRVRYNGAGVEVDPPDHPIAEDVRASFHRHLGELQTQDISAWLCRRAELVSAVGLRDTGGIYFVPRGGLDTWRRIAAAVREASLNRVFEVPALTSEEAVDAILDAVAQEAEQAAAKMEEALHAGELGARALRGRADRCDAIKQKVEMYEQLMGRGVARIHERLDGLRQNLVVAALAAEEDSDGA